MALAVIPARYSSTRFPGKVLYPLAGKPMIQWVWERTKEARLLSRVVIATDSEEVIAIARGFGAEAVLTSSSHSSGTSRVAEVAEGLTHDIVINVQGDEPLVDPMILDALVQELKSTPWASIATPVIPIKTELRLFDSNVVKLVMTGSRRILYFSRAPIPHGFVPSVRPGVSWEHQGIYAFRSETLASLKGMGRSPLEEAEGLEQLRFLEENHVFVGVISSGFSPGVNTMDDVPLVERRLREKGKP